MYTIELQGNGMPLLMLHGWGQSHEALRPLGELLSSKVTPILVDLPGFGQSKSPESIWSAYDYADALIRHLDMQDIEKVSLLGHSFGGKVAMCLALRYPHRIEKLILIAASGIPAKRKFFSKLKLKLIRFSAKSIKNIDHLLGTKYFTHSFSPRFGSRDYQNANPQMRSILVKSVNEDLSSLIPQIKCETLMLWGENDCDTPLELGRRLANLIPHSSFYSFPNRDHQLPHGASAHLCAKYILPFLVS